MVQATFRNIEYSFRKKETKREEFLETMEETIGEPEVHIKLRNGEDDGSAQ